MADDQNEPISEETEKAVEAFEASFATGRVHIPRGWNSGIVPHLKWVVFSFAIGLLVLMICIALSWVLPR